MALAAIGATSTNSGLVLAQERPAFFNAKDIAEAGIIYGLRFCEPLGDIAPSVAFPHFGEELLVYWGRKRRPVS